MKNLRALLTVLAVVSVFAACSKKDKTADKADPPKGADADAGPPVDAAPPSPLQATIEDKPYTFPGAFIEAATQNDKITLSTRAGGCGTEEVEGDVQLAVSIATGPGGKRFASTQHAVGVRVSNDKEKYATGATELAGVLVLEPTEWKEGGKVKGVLKFDDAAKADDGSIKKYSGYGAFEAEICSLSTDEWRYQATPEKADEGPAKGEGGGIKFAFKSGVAVMRHDETRHIDRIEAIHLFDADVACDTYSSAKGPQVTLKDIGGAQGPTPLVGTHQDVSTVRFDEEGKDQFGVYGPGWIKFDALELKDGAELKGTVHVESSAAKTDPKPPARLSGSFTAKVCKK